MRHRKHKVSLGREKGPRRLLLRNLATSVLLYEKVRTTAAKAHAIRPIVERLVTRAKIDSVAGRRALARVCTDPLAVKKAFDVLGPRYKTRPGGYTRTIKLKQRQGDAARMARIEFV